MSVKTSRKAGALTASIIVLACLLFILMKSSPTVSAKSFVYDAGHGMVFKIPASHASFMNLPMQLAIDRGSFGPMSVPAAEVKRANKILSVLPGCVREAEQQLLQYAGADMVQSQDDIQNPHVWLPDQVEHPDDWTLVVEMKDNEGYGWHIEFRGDKFMQIWSGS